MRLTTGHGRPESSHLGVHHSCWQKVLSLPSNGHQHSYSSDVGLLGTGWLRGEQGHRASTPGVGLPGWTREVSMIPPSPQNAQDCAGLLTQGQRCCQGTATHPGSHPRSLQQHAPSEVHDAALAKVSG